MNYDFHSRKSNSNDSIDLDKPMINSTFVKIDLKSPISVKDEKIESINGRFVQNTSQGSLFEPLDINSVRRFRIDFMFNGIYLLVYSNDEDLTIIESEMTTIDWINEDGIVVKSEERNDSIIDFDEYFDDKDLFDLDYEYSEETYRDTIKKEEQPMYNEKIKNRKIL